MTQHDTYEQKTELEKPEEQLQDSQQKPQLDDTGNSKENPKDTLFDDSPNETGGDDLPSEAGSKVKTPKVEDALPKRKKGRPRKNPPKEPIVERNDDDVDDMIIEENNEEITRIEKAIMENENNATEINNKTKQLKDKKKQLEKENNKEWREQQKNKQTKLSWLICQAQCEKKGIPHLAESAPLDTLSKKELQKIKEIAEKKPEKYRDLLTAIRRKERKEEKD